MWLISLIASVWDNWHCVYVPAFAFVGMLLSIYGAGSFTVEAEISFIYMQIMWCEAQLAHPLVCD